MKLFLFALYVISLCTIVECSQPCIDNDNGALDSSGSGCSTYQQSFCGHYNDNDFNSNTMCCVCGGGNNLECTEDSHCGLSKPACDTTSNTCIECINHNHCYINNPMCVSNNCRSCIDNDNGALDSSNSGCSTYQQSFCGHYNDNDFNSNTMCCVCGGGNNLECMVDSQCHASKPICDTPSNTCVECNTEGDCNELGKSVCSTDKTCVECTDNTHCSGTLFCESNTCIECSDHSHCSGTLFCESNTCIECSDHSHCNDVSKPACSSNVCVELMGGAVISEATSASELQKASAQNLKLAYQAKGVCP
jgi:hypothetical protein